MFKKRFIIPGILSLCLSMPLVSGQMNFLENNIAYAAEYNVTGKELVVGKNEKYTSISKALNAAKAGDVILVRGGTYNEEIVLSKSGKANAYITIRNYPGETPVLDGNGMSTIFDFNGQDYINFEGFKIQNIKNKQWAHGVYLGGGEKYINLRNLEITGIINPKPTSDNYGANPLVLFGEKSDSIAHVVIENCYVHDNVTGWCEAIAVSGNCEDIKVLNNRVDNNGNIGIDFCGNFGYAPSNDQPRNCVAKGNVISNCNSPYATSYGLYADGAYDILFEDNIIYNSQGGIEIGAEEKTNNKVGDIIVRNNLVYGCSENGITVGGYETGLGNVDNVLISHNTVVNNNCELTLSKCSNVTIQDNIFKGKELVYSEMSSSYTKNIKFNNNVYDGSGFRLANKSYNASSWLSNIDKNAIMKSIKLDDNFILLETIKGSDGLLVGHTASKVQEPEKPQEPVVPEKPQQPQQPVVPEQPQEPEQPVKPQEPAVPEKPPVIEPEQPQEPQQPQQPEKPQSPQQPKPEEEQKPASLLPIFKRDVWFTDKNVSSLKFINDNSLSFKSKNAWTGVWLEDTSMIKKNSNIKISVKKISNNTEIQIYENGKEIAVLNNKTKEKNVKFSSKAKNIDICIVSTKKNVSVEVQGLVIQNNK